MSARWSLIALSAAATAVCIYKWRQSKMSSAHSTSEAGIDETSDESFPASDAPSWTPVTGSATQAH